MEREEAIKIIEANCSCSDSKLREACAVFIPELRESEDERIRKAIDEIMKLSRAWRIAGKYGLTAGDIRKWLKKQKEQIEVVEQLKSLGYRPSWKPSEEQMEALYKLYNTFYTCSVGAKYRDILESLYNQLKKLQQ